MSSLALQELIKETQLFLSSIANAVEGEDGSETDADGIRQRKSAVESKFRTFMNDFNINKSKLSTQDQIRRLETLKKEIANRDAYLESLQKQLKDFELELCLRNGGARKRELDELARERKKQQTLATAPPSTKEPAQNVTPQPSPSI